MPPPTFRRAAQLLVARTARPLWGCFSPTENPAFARPAHAEAARESESSSGRQQARASRAYGLSLLGERGQWMPVTLICRTGCRFSNAPRVSRREKYCSHGVTPLALTSKSVTITASGGAPPFAVSHEMISAGESACRRFLRLVLREHLTRVGVAFVERRRAPLSAKLVD